MEPICAALDQNTSTYYAAKKREREPCERAKKDEELKPEIMRVWTDQGRKRYGADKVWQELKREQVAVARCTVERLMGELGICGAPHCA